jgi:hypothetical protein
MPDKKHNENIMIGYFSTAANGARAGITGQNMPVSDGQARTAAPTLKTFHREVVSPTLR